MQFLGNVQATKAHKLVLFYPQETRSRERKRKKFLLQDTLLNTIVTPIADKQTWTEVRHNQSQEGEREKKPSDGHTVIINLNKLTSL